MHTVLVSVRNRTETEENRENSRTRTLLHYQGSFGVLYIVSLALEQSYNKLYLHQQQASKLLLHKVNYRFTSIQTVKNPGASEYFQQQLQ